MGCNFKIKPEVKTYSYEGEAELIAIEHIRPSRMLGRKEPKLPRLKRAREELAAGAVLAPVAVFRHNGEYLLADGMHRYTVAKEAGLTHLPCVFWDPAWSINRGEWS
jgi:ParB-like chromosome segregation protein Spo0J